jgi:uncharacterized membrane protein YkvA (DUF1232 family)
MAKDNMDYYRKLRKKFETWIEGKGGSHKWAKYLIWAPDLFYLLLKLSTDDEVAPKEKAKLIVALTYFITPIDLIPEGFLGPVGYVDDIALAAYVLNSILSNTNEEVVRKHWAGEEDVLDVIRQILSVANQMVGSGLWKKLKRLV